MPSEVTHWLHRLRDGDPDALERLVVLLYDELRQAARRRLRAERAEHTLNTTALVHETYLRLVDQRRVEAADRSEFVGVAAATMRRVLVDYARARLRHKRGGGVSPVPLEEAEPLLGEHEAEELLALHDALDRLERVEPRAARVVEHRFFGGLQLAETAAVLGVSTKTVQRDWTTARAWLRKEVGAGLGR